MSNHSEIHDEDELIETIRSKPGSDNFVSTTLKTDERVIARVTDGIYRQPGSALRELISNAYDADATRVVIKTDPPRFERVSVEDNGHGMTPEVMAHLLFHIGGSAKRSTDGQTLGVTAKNNPYLSPGGRRLIGKIGIGLFSVSQLTHSFQVVTKTKGDKYRTVATVALKQYGDDAIVDQKGGKARFESGRVHIWREVAADVDSHGTTVVLTSIRPQARDTLRSREIWATIEQEEQSTPAEERQSIEPPRFHIGRVDHSGDLLRRLDGEITSLPWEKSDNPEQAFQKLVQAVWDEVGQSSPNPQIERIFDYYLRMVWQLALAIPVPYVDGHLFDMDLAGWAEAFELSNRPKGSARRLALKNGRALRDELALKDPSEKVGNFEVLFDGLKLLRPIKFTNLPKTDAALKIPLVFLGKCREEFGKVPHELSGGPLAFEAYLFWTPKIAPTEHQGSLIRIHGSSGTLFDPTFMRYQVSEQRRLRQITCEIFVSEGLDSALNIDRESFNNAHPHSVYITKWLHGALRQLATSEKKLASELRSHARDTGHQLAVSEIQGIANEIWESETGDTGSKPPQIKLTDLDERREPSDAYVFRKSAVAPRSTKANTPKQRAYDSVMEEKLKAIAQVLASFGLLDGLARRKQEKLLKAIHDILNASEE